MPTKTIPNAVLGKRSAGEAERLAVATAAALGAVLKPILEQLATDKNDRHVVANAAETAGLKAHEAAELAKVNESRLNGIEKRLDSLMGDGTGRNGAIAEMDRNIGDVKGDVRDLKNQVTSDNRELKNQLTDISQQMTKFEQGMEKSQGFMAGWGGAKMALVIVGLLVSLLGGLIALLVRMK